MLLKLMAQALGIRRMSIQDLRRIAQASGAQVLISFADEMEKKLLMIYRLEKQKKFANKELETMTLFSLKTANKPNLKLYY